MQLFDAKLLYVRAQFDARGVVAHIPRDRMLLAFAALPEPEISFQEWLVSAGIQIEPSPEEGNAEEPLTAAPSQPDPSATSGGGLKRIPVVIDEKREQALDALDDKLTSEQIAAHNDELIAEMKRAAKAGRLPEGIKIG
jgi:hypothetical protein